MRSRTRSLELYSIAPNPTLLRALEKTLLHLAGGLQPVSKQAAGAKGNRANTSIWE